MIIIDTNVVLDEICVSATIWGFDDVDGREATLFKLPFRIRRINGQIDPNYSKELANEILAHLKFVLGCVYDTYNLVMYDKPPLLPKVAQWELSHNVDGAFLHYENIQSLFAGQYENIYSSVLGKGRGNLGFAELPTSFKKTIVHNLRLEYALAVKRLVRPEEFIKYLDESIKSWCELRTTLSVVDFLKSLTGDKEKILRYFSVEDVNYFKRLCEAYNESIIETPSGEACLALKDDVLSLESEIEKITTKTPIFTPAKFPPGAIIIL